MVRGTNPTPTLSDAPSPIDASLKNYFKERVQETLRTAAVDVRHDPSVGSPVPASIFEILSRPSNLVRASRAIATHLYNCQTGANPGGLVVVVDGQLDDARCVAILKLEREEALRLTQRNVRGHRTFDVQHLRDLMLGNKTRVFKAGLFPHVGAVSRLWGRVSDQQRSFMRAGEVADFFLTRFLGCSLAEEPDVVTKRNFEFFESFINTTVSDPERKARYELALLAEMEAPSPQFNPRGFAAYHFEREDEEAFLAEAAASGLSLDRFDKDVHLIAARVRQMVMQFANGLRLSGTRTSFEESVTIEAPAQGETNVNIRAPIEKFGRS